MKLKNQFAGPLGLIVVGSTFAAFATSSVLAASSTWNGTTSALWSDASNWAGPPVLAPGTGEIATFNNAGNGRTTLDLGAGVTISSVVFDTASAAAHTLGSGAVGSQTLVLNNTGNITVNAAVAANQLVNANVTLGTVATAQNFTFANNSAANTLTLAGAIANSSTGTAYDQIRLNGTGSTYLTGAIGSANNQIYIDKYDAGTATLSGTSTFIGSIAVHAGKFVWSGTNTTVVAATAGGWIALADTAATKARLDITGGTLTRYDFGIGSNATATGAVYQSGGSFTLTRAANVADFRLGSVAGGYGYYSLSGTGSFTTNEAGLGGAFNDSVGVMDVSGGTFTSNGWITLGRGGATSSGLLNVTGGLVEFSKTAGAADANNSRLGLQWGGTAGAQSVVNIANGTVTGDDYIDLAVTNTTGTLGVINLLNGGLLQGSRVTAATANPVALLNFNGGTLRANGTNAGVNFMNSANIDGVYVYSGGGTIDNNGTAITVSRPLAAPTGNGVASITVSNGGSGYVGAPLVKISGDGIGATAYATINEATGVLTGIVVTNRGTGYTTAPTVTLTGGGGSGATLGTAALAANTSGGMKFQGSGATMLNVASSYTGATTVTGGTLNLATGADINSSSSVTINGSGAKLLVGESNIVSPPVTLTQGSVDGKGSITSLTVANAVGNSLSAGGGGTGVLMTDALTFQGAATINVTASGLVADRYFLANTLATNAAGQVVVNASNSSGFWSPGDYSIITYGAFSGSIAHFVKGTIPDLLGSQTATLVNTGSEIVLRITGSPLTWTGALGADWTTTAQAAPKNWKTGAAQADFANGNPVLFDDSSTRFGVNLASNVSPATTVFDNSDPNTYTVASSGGFGISGGSVVKSNTGTTIFTTANATTGTVTISGGVLQLGDGVTNGSFAASSQITNNASLVFKTTGSQTVTNPIAGTGFATMGGTGALTLAGANNFTGGGVALASGTLNVNHASAIGSTAAGSLTISGGTLDNTSGAAITTTTAKAQTWSGGFTFTGTSDLNFNGGVVTLAGGDSVAATMAGGTLTTGAFASPDTGLSLAGPGVLAVSTAVASNIGGTLNVAAGAKLRINTGANNATTSDFIATGLTGSGTVENGGGVERWLFVNPATDQTFPGLLQNGSTGALGLNKGGAGTLTLTGNNTYTGRTSITAGTLSVATISQAGFAGPLGAAIADAGSIYLGNNAGTGTLLYTGGDVTLDRGFTTAANAGNSGVIDTNANMTFTGAVNGVNAGGFIKRGNGVLTLSNSSTTQKLSNGTNGGGSVFGVNVALGKLALKNGTFTTVGEVVVGGQLQTTANFNAGFLDITNSGTLNVPNWISIGRGNGTVGLSSELTVDGGTLNQTLATAGLSMGYDAAVVGFNANPVLTVKGASTVNVAGTFYAGESLGASATLHVLGTSAVNLTNATQANKVLGNSGKGTLELTSGTVNAGSGLTLGRNAGGEGVILLNGGILDTASIAAGLGTSSIHFNGGILRANVAGTTFLQGLTGASVDAGGAVIDTQAFAITVAQALSAGSGAGGLTKNGTGSLTLGGVNTYVGNTTVAAGSLTLADNAGLKFAIGANGVANKITGAGSATIEGDFTLDLTGAAIANGNSWTLVDTATKSFTANFSVADGFTEVADVWTKVDGSNTWTFTEATGVLTLSVGGGGQYASWASAKGLTGSNNGATQDPDGDGISNALEFVLGGNPLTSDTGKLPAATTDANNFIFTFSRADESESEVGLVFQWGSSLAGWTDVAIGASGAGAVAVTENGTAPDTVVVTIPKSSATGGKLFGRVKAVK